MKRKKLILKWMLGAILITCSSSVFTQTKQILDDGKEQIECVTEDQYQLFLRPAIENNIARLRQEGKLHADNFAKMGGEVKFGWPLRMADNYKEIDGVNSYFYISNFADIDHDESYRLDWECHTAIGDTYYFGGAKNYDQHNGADIVPYPFPWQMMDDENVDIVAAADGQVIHMYNGNSIDRNCDTPHVFNYEPFNDGYYGNFIALLHDDNSITVYAHMKSGTMANLEVDDMVVAGQYLGKIGSSGNSSAPHLHFEFRHCEDCQYDEPWFDPEGCNEDVTESRWLDQIPYYEPEVLRVATHNNIPVFKDCAEYESGGNETINMSNHFSTAEVLMISVAMRDFFVDDVIDVDIINSAGAILENMDWVATSNYYRELFFFTTSLAGYATGTYKIRVTHQGKFYYHFFTVNCPAAQTLSGTHTGVRGYLNGDNINSTATISGVSTNDVLYQAENYVKLNVGFKATQNCEFRGQIDDCTIDGMKEIIDPLTGLQENSILVFPNPTFGEFQVLYKDEQNFDAEIFIRDQLGRIMYQSEKFHDTNSLAQYFDFTSYPKGIYYVELKLNTGIKSTPVVIQ